MAVPNFNILFSDLHFPIIAGIEMTLPNKGEWVKFGLLLLWVGIQKIYGGGVEMRSEELA